MLWVTPEPPDRARGGGSIRQSYLLEAVARAMRVDVLAISDGTADPYCRDAAHVIEQVAEPLVRRAPAFIPGSLREIWTTEVLRMTPAVADTRKHRRALKPLMDRGRGYDIVHFEHDRLAPLGEYLGAVRRTVTLHNLRSEQAAHRLLVETSRTRRWLARRQRAVALAFETRVSRSFDALFVTSPDDAAALTGPTVVVPNGVDVERIRCAPLTPESRIVFTGRLDWQPNVDGLRWFCRAVLPLVRRQVPRVELDIVGFNPVGEVLALESSAVRIHPNVPSTLPFLHAARVAIVPLHVGSGTRLKALEAMASGRPVVGTTIGLAGLGLTPGVHASVHDDANLMAAAIVRLLEDDQTATTLSQMARRHVEQHFDWRPISRRFAATMRALAEGSAQ